MVVLHLGAQIIGLSYSTQSYYYYFLNVHLLLQLPLDTYARNSVGHNYTRSINP